MWLELTGNKETEKEDEIREVITEPNCTKLFMSRPNSDFDYELRPPKSFKLRNDRILYNKRISMTAVLRRD